jgi:tRNA(His) 5'-end guanylyltransferase
LASDKNEILFQRRINYNNEPEQFRKGTVLVKDVSEYLLDILTVIEIFDADAFGFDQG